MNTLFAKLDQSVVKYWQLIGRTEKDFYCRSCGELMLDLDDFKNVEVILDTRENHPRVYEFVRRVFPRRQKMSIFNGTRAYIENENNRWLIKGRVLSGKSFYRHTCWKCFFKNLRATVDVARKARKSSWYKQLLDGNDVIPIPTVSPSSIFHLIFDITDDELNAERKKFDTASLESFIRRHGEVEGRKKFEAYSNRQAYTCSKEYMTIEKGMTEKQWKDFNTNRACTKKNFIKRYGQQLGEKKWLEYCQREAYAGNSLEYFIEKLGQEAGTKKYIQVNMEKQLTLQNFVRKYGPIDGPKKFDKLKHKNYSACSQELFFELDRRLGKLAEKSAFELKNGEASLAIEIDGKPRVVRPDYLLGNKIIEFYGDLWHANPKKYAPDDIVILPYGLDEIIAKDVWKRDKAREESLKNSGYQVKVIWENDYKLKTAEIIDECCRFLQH